ncbi:DMT family transporter [Hoeflea sp. TYP-13]|uniref:DMT family transporter n=1 Tax=Hoeflea sp. TYP-13 TaxID=3230023 RepID=UPI0034C670ED
MSNSDNKQANGAALGIMVVVAATVSISLSSIFAPMVYDTGSNPQTLTVFRFGCFALVCGAWLKFRSTRTSLSRRDLMHCIGAGIVYTIATGSLVASFAFIPVSLAVLILYLFPLLTRLGESLLDRQRPAMAEIACFIGALVGLVICLGIGFDQLNMPGLVFSAMAAIGVATSFLWTGRKLPAVQPTVTTFYMAVTGTIVSVGFTIGTGAWAPPPAELIAGIIMAAAALSFAGGFLGMFAGVRIIGASRTAMVMNLEPVVTIILALMILKEDLSATQFLGAALVITAIFAAQKIPASGQTQGL